MLRFGKTNLFSLYLRSPRFVFSSFSSNYSQYDVIVIGGGHAGC